MNLIDTVRSPWTRNRPIARLLPPQDKNVDKSLACVRVPSKIRTHDPNVREPQTVEFHSLERISLGEIVSLSRTWTLSHFQQRYCVSFYRGLSSILVPSQDNLYHFFFNFFKLLSTLKIELCKQCYIMTTQVVRTVCRQIPWQAIDSLNHVRLHLTSGGNTKFINHRDDSSFIVSYVGRTAIDWSVP